MKKKFRIIFINVLDHSIKLQSSYPHLGIGYLISYLKKEMKDVDYYVSNYQNSKQIKDFKPDIIALSSVTQNFSKAKEIASVLKAIIPSCPIIVGGVHISSLPESMDPHMDVGVIGEGEETFLALTRHIRENNNFLNELDNINGIIFWKDRKLVKTKKRNLITKLDSIPHPDRGLLPNRENQLLLTSRGCPYKCAFCSSSYFWENIRYFSVDYILEEIEQIIKKYPVLNLTIYDDLFVFNMERLAEISSKVFKAGYHKKVNFWCNARSDFINSESIEYLKRMNVKGVGIGLESGSDRIIKMVKSGNLSLEVNKRAIDLCRQNGIFVHGSFMLGSPYETEEDMLKTRDFIMNSGIDKGDISVAVPFPGTKFWEYALNEKLVSVNMDWSKLAIHNIDNLPSIQGYILLTREVSKQRFLEIFKEISLIIISKRKEYEKKWDRLQGREIRLSKIFSLITIKKIIKDPLRGLRYAINIVFTLPERIAHLFNNKYK